MPEVVINYWAVLVSGVAAFVLGGIWYGPLFGKQWGKLMGWGEEKMEQMKKDPVAKKKIMKAYVVHFLASLVMAYVLANILDFAKATTVSAGMQGAFWTWLGFIATTFLGMVLWGGKSFKLYCIDAGFYLVNMLIMGSILAVWQ